MGNSAVAVLHYDEYGEIELAAPRMAQAMRDMAGADRPKDFGFGRVISWGHSSDYQICVVHGNTGWPIWMDNEVPEDVLAAVVDVLKSRGFKVTPPKSQGDRTPVDLGKRELEPND